MSRVPCFVANWKMHKTLSEAEAYFRDFEKGWSQHALPLEAVLAPSFTALASVSRLMKQASLEITGLSAQNVHFESAGAFTGEISAGMLFEIGCRYVMIGHSERRHLFGENDTVIHQKIRALRRTGLLPILCIGETLQERQAGKTWEILESQLSAALDDLEDGFTDKLSDWMIAYEPVWAIGSGETPFPEEISKIHQKIQGFILDRLKKGLPRILYGGSVSEKNIASFMNQDSIDGVLVGGASLSADSFLKIIELGAMAKQASKI